MKKKWYRATTEKFNLFMACCKNDKILGPRLQGSHVNLFFKGQYNSLIPRYAPSVLSIKIYYQNDIIVAESNKSEFYFISIVFTFLVVILGIIQELRFGIFTIVQILIFGLALLVILGIHLGYLYERRSFFKQIERIIKENKLE